MYAVIQTGGKQVRVEAGKDVKVEKLPGQVGDEVVFDKVLLAHDGEKVHIGRPFLDSARVLGTIKGQGRDRKILVFKYKRRKNYRRKRGHRQHFTLVHISDIEKQQVG